VISARRRLQPNRCNPEFQATRRPIEERSGTSVKTSLSRVINKSLLIGAQDIAILDIHVLLSAKPSLPSDKTIPSMADFVETLVIQTDILHTCIIDCQLRMTNVVVEQNWYSFKSTFCSAGAVEAKSFQVSRQDADLNS
jgi:hypothetical protein